MKDPFDCSTQDQAAKRRPEAGHGDRTRRPLRGCGMAAIRRSKTSGALFVLAAICGWGLYPASAFQVGEPGGPFPSLCKHTGTEWEMPRVVDQGQPQCPSATFKLTIGVDGVGASVTAGFNGCPGFLVIKPGRFKKVQKLHHNAVNPQPLKWYKTTYDADCGVPLLSPPSCTAKASAETGNSSTTWEEEGCDFRG